MPGLGGFRNLGLIIKLKSHENISSAIIEFFQFSTLLTIKVVSLWRGGGHMVITSFCALVVAISPAQTLQVTYLQLSCNWMFELLAMACNRSFNMLNVLHVILGYLSQFSSHLETVFTIILGGVMVRLLFQLIEN